MSSIKYKSTRGDQHGLTFEEVVLQGLAKDKGLFVPENIPSFTAKQIEQVRRFIFSQSTLILATCLNLYVIFICRCVV
jgi:threonine synthase